MINMKDPKDILKEIKADMSGVSSDKVTFSNFRDRKKKKKKVKKTVESESSSDIVDNDEGFGITDVFVETCGYGDIGQKRKLRVKNNLEEWGAFDFFLYAQKKYTDKYGQQWDLNIGGGSLEINRIRDKFHDLFGFCCNLIMRDYIDFFFNNYMDTAIRENESFYFKQMRNDKIMCEFYDGYNFSQSFLKYTELEKTDNKSLISNKEVRESYLIGDTSLVSNYGIVISLNWLIKVKGISPTESTRMVLVACRELAAKGMTDIIKSSTETYSPYPSSIQFKNPQLVMDRIDKDVNLSVEFNDDSVYKFLQ